MRNTPRHWFIFFALTAALSSCAQPAQIKDEDTLSESEKALYLTRTGRPQPSPQLARALELDVAPWHKPGVKHIAVTLPKEAIQQSQETALAALQALPAEAAEDDFDRAWIVLQQANALRDLGRDAEATSAYEKLRLMPHTPQQDWFARASLYAINEKQNNELCAKGQIQRAARLEELPYPREAARRAIDGKVWVLLDVEPDGTVSNALVDVSSMRAFEAVTIQQALESRWINKWGSAMGHRCFVRTCAGFRAGPAYLAQFTPDQIVPDDDFSYHSIGAAIRVRAAARAAVLAKANQPPAALRAD